VRGSTLGVSICIVTGRRRHLLERCLRSIHDQEGAPPHEVLVCSDGDPEVEAVVHAVVPGARVAFVPGAHVGAARNVLIRQARGNILLFLDDDVVAHPRLLHRLVALAADHPDVAVFGGPNLTPPGSSLFQVVQGGVLASMVGAGPVRRRYGRHPAGAAHERFFTLCNMAVRRDAMVEFPVELSGGEENAVLIELSRRGEAMLYDPGLAVYHERRARLRPFARQMYKYGVGRGEVIVRDPAGAAPANFAPLGLFLYLAVAPVLAVILSPLVLGPAALYATAVGATGVKIAWPLRRARAAALGVLLVPVVHACYAAGLVSGLARRPDVAVEPIAVWAGEAGAVD
jgi:GT2 family glycosyltransferase